MRIRTDRRVKMEYGRDFTVEPLRMGAHKCSLILFWLVSVNGAFFGFFWD
jgi:hypothetical protein